MNTIIEKIRAEIINRINKRHLSEQAKNELVSILSFISDLEKEEKPTLQEQPIKTDIVEDLKHYLSTTPKEQIEKDWESLKEWGKVGPSVSEFLGWKQPICEGLEEDVKSWFFDEISSKINVEHTMYYYFQECARRYAQWGAEHAKND